VSVAFDMIHVCPPQTAPDFIRVSPLSDAAGWVDVDQASLRHKTYANIWSLGDVMSAPNAKTAAAARKQAPVVAENVLADIAGRSAAAQYDGYGSCPLTVERGKIVLAEFGYGGVLKPSFPGWLINGTRPSRVAWFLKAKMLPSIYWRAMLRGREWLAKPEPVRAAPTAGPYNRARYSSPTRPRCHFAATFPSSIGDGPIPVRRWPMTCSLR
jgi:sulfide:quinone oxidoreductase